MRDDPSRARICVSWARSDLIDERRSVASIRTRLDVRHAPHISPVRVVCGYRALHECQRWRVQNVFALGSDGELRLTTLTTLARILAPV
jgi:hypothetical protein